MSQLIMMPKLERGMGRSLLLYLTGVNNSVQPQKVTQLPPKPRGKTTQVAKLRKIALPKLITPQTTTHVKPFPTN